LLERVWPDGRRWLCGGKGKAESGKQKVEIKNGTPGVVTEFLLSAFCFQLSLRKS
jgi:hypothetical protein